MVSLHQLQIGVRAILQPPRYDSAVMLLGLLAKCRGGPDWLIENMGSQPRKHVDLEVEEH